MSGSYDCMTPAELTLWQEQAAAVIREAGKGTTVPCFDCPLWYHLQEQAAGRCNRRPQSNGRPSHHLIPTPALERRRARKRQWMRDHRGSQRAQIGANL
jgi:hypothetical protein